MKPTGQIRYVNADGSLSTSGLIVLQSMADQITALGGKIVSVADATHTPSSVYAYHRYTHVSGCAVTIPANATNALPVGTEFHLCQRGGALTIAGDTGVTVNIPTGTLAATDRVGAVVTVKKVGADEWDAFGLLAV